MSIDSVYSAIKIIIIVGLSVLAITVLVSVFLPIILKRIRKKKNMKSTEVYCINSGLTMDNEPIYVVSHNTVGTL